MNYKHNENERKSPARGMKRAASRSRRLLSVLACLTLSFCLVQGQQDSTLTDAKLRDLFSQSLAKIADLEAKDKASVEHIKELEAESVKSQEAIDKAKAEREAIQKDLDNERRISEAYKVALDAKDEALNIAKQGKAKAEARVEQQKGVISLLKKALGVAVVVTATAVTIAVVK